MVGTRRLKKSHVSDRDINEFNYLAKCWSHADTIFSSGSNGLGMPWGRGVCCGGL